MDIAGGLYRELCETPRWDAIHGSGGRAAAAVLKLSSEVRLHTYVSAAHHGAAERLRALGVDVHPAPADATVVFAYFHPLSRPHLQPPPSELRKAPTIEVEAEAVLRFGMVEGDARVGAKRAVFDPQTAREAASFRANGSRAESLALVLNEGELRALAHQDDLQAAAQAALLQEEADVLVVKRGIRGVRVFTAAGGVEEIPAYRSREVFKIGTGDVFSAHFAYWWGEAGRPPAEAADRASRAVAAYAETRALPPPPDAGTREPRRITQEAARVLLLGQADTLGRRYVLEEARFGLRELGVEVACPALDRRGAASPEPFDAVLAVAEAMPAVGGADLARLAANRPGVIFREASAGSAPSGGMKEVWDFTTALYEAAWSALS